MPEDLPDEKYKLIAEKMLTNSATPEEESEFAAWYNQYESGDLEIPASFAPDQSYLEAHLLKKINSTTAKVVPMWTKVIRSASIAAAIALLIFSAWYLTGDTNDNKLQQLSVDLKPDDITAGLKGAMLQMPGGKKILLDTAKNGRLADGFQKSDNEVFLSTNAATIDYYTLSTPRARQQQLRLPDGSRVWLNAESSINFPNSFIGNTREVTVTGEVYFEIAKDPLKTFIVKCEGTEVNVLGTSFNMMAYKNEAALLTTLVEGSVMVSAGSQSVQLRPGEQSGWKAGNNLLVDKNADIEMVMAWKNGLQVYKQTSLSKIMRQIERSYNVDVIDKQIIPADITFSGQIPGDVSLAGLLKVLETENVHFEIDSQHRIVKVTGR